MNAPTARTVRLIDRREPTRPFVDAALRRSCAPNLLSRVEDEWATAREQLAATSDIDHAHWNWRNKSESVATGRHTLTAVECEGAVQGLMALARAARAAVLGSGALVYVDYLETAPWNLRAPEREARFSGVGTVLLLDAVLFSRESGHEGRVGLHSLPQAEAFYRQCGFAPLGCDAMYYNLAYYELSSARATQWLNSTGCDQ